MKQESIKKLHNNLDVLVGIHTRLIDEGKFNEAFNVMKNIEATIRQLKELGIPVIIEEETDNHFLDWYNILKFFIEVKQSQLIQLDYSSIDAEKKHRGTGKTTAITKLSSEYKIPIYAKNRYTNPFKDRAEEFNLNPIVIDDFNQLKSTQYKYNNILLVDEYESMKMDKFLGIGVILIGFTRKIT